MNKICTSIEQSQKLIDLGIDIITADMRYGYVAPYEFSDCMYDGGYDPTPYYKDFFIKNPMFSMEEYDGELFAWSLTALLSILPFPVLYMEMVAGMILWSCKCHFMETDRTVKIEHYENPVDAVFEMVCLLKENGKL